MNFSDNGSIFSNPKWTTLAAGAAIASAIAIYKNATSTKWIKVKFALNPLS